MLFSFTSKKMPGITVNVKRESDNELISLETNKAVCSLYNCTYLEEEELIYIDNKILPENFSDLVTFLDESIYAIELNKANYAKQFCTLQ